MTDRLTSMDMGGHSEQLRELSEVSMASRVDFLGDSLSGTLLRMDCEMSETCNRTKPFTMEDRDAQKWEKYMETLHEIQEEVFDASEKKQEKKKVFWYYNI